MRWDDLGCLAMTAYAISGAEHSNFSLAQPLPFGWEKRQVIGVCLSRSDIDEGPEENLRLTWNRLKALNLDDFLLILLEAFHPGPMMS